MNKEIYSIVQQFTSSNESNHIAGTEKPGVVARGLKQFDC